MHFISLLLKVLAQDKQPALRISCTNGALLLLRTGIFKTSIHLEIPVLFIDSVAFKNWEQVFIYLTDRLFKTKTRVKKILFLDELQWMAVGRSKLVSLLKFFWDNHWKDKNFMLILCGSVASFMIKKVLHSKALYGRTTLEMLLKGLSPPEASQLIGNKRNYEEI